MFPKCRHCLSADDGTGERLKTMDAYDLIEVTAGSGPNRLQEMVKLILNAPFRMSNQSSPSCV